MPIAYKVTCTGFNGQLHSSAIDGQSRVTYYVGEEVQRNKGCGPLMLFADLQDAFDYMRAMKSERHTLKVWEATYDASSDDKVWMRSGLTSTKEDVISTLVQILGIAIRGSLVLADTVRLVKEIERMG